MSVLRFTLTIEGADIATEVAQDRLFDAGCDDATFSVVDGVQIAEFDRHAAHFADAVADAIKAVESAVPGARVTEIRRESEAAASS